MPAGTHLSVLELSSCSHTGSLPASGQTPPHVWMHSAPTWLCCGSWWVGAPQGLWWVNTRREVSRACSCQVPDHIPVPFIEPRVTSPGIGHPLSLSLLLRPLREHRLLPPASWLSGLESASPFPSRSPSGLIPTCCFRPPPTPPGPTQETHCALTNSLGSVVGHRHEMFPLQTRATDTPSVK